MNNTVSSVTQGCNTFLKSQPAEYLFTCNIHNVKTLNMDSY